MMNRALMKKQLRRGLNTVFGLEYKRHPEQWRQIFEVYSSDQATEEDVLVVGLGAGKVKPEGRGVDYDVGGESWTKYYRHETVALAFALTEEAQEDNLYMNLGAKYARAQARSMQHTKEIKGANVLNYGFTGGATAIGDGQPLFSTAHPLWNGSNGANTLATQADLAEASMEDMLTVIFTMVDDRGIPVSAQAVKLIVPPALQFTAQRLLMTPGRVGTADNDINAIKSMGLVSGGFAVNQRLTDANAWFIKTDVPDGFKHFVRRPLRKRMQEDFETGNLRYKADERYVFGVTEWRAGCGSSGLT